ncbi:hypothetical protein ACFL05_00680 [Patescibacteria group bacterium]
MGSQRRTGGRKDELEMISKLDEIRFCFWKNFLSRIEHTVNGNFFKNKSEDRQFWNY